MRHISIKYVDMFYIKKEIFTGIPLYEYTCTPIKVNWCAGRVALRQRDKINSGFPPTILYLVKKNDAGFVMQKTQLAIGIIERSSLKKSGFVTQRINFLLRPRNRHFPRPTETDWVSRIKCVLKGTTDNGWSFLSFGYKKETEKVRG